MSVLFFFPHFFANSFCTSISSLIYFFENFIASSIFSSLSSLAPASIITVSLSFPTITRSSSLVSSSVNVGLTINLPSTRPTRTAPIGPAKGISDMESAQDAPFKASMSESFSASVESTIATT